MSETGRRFLPYYFVVAGVLLQGLSPVITKLLLNAGMNSEIIVGARYLLAVLFLVPFGIPTQRRLKITGKPRIIDWISLILVGALGSGVGALLFTAALQYSSAGIVNAISKTAPIFVAFMGYVILRESVNIGRLLLVLAMILADVFICLGEFNMAGPHAHARLLGDGLALAAGLCRAVSEITAKGALQRFSPATVTFSRFLVGFLVMAVAAILSGSWREIPQISMQSLGLLFVLGVICTAVSMYLYYHGTADIPVHVAVSLKIVGAIATAVLGWIVLKEVWNLYHVIGMTLLVSSAYLLILRSVREPATHAHPPPFIKRTRKGLRDRLTFIMVGFTVTAVILTMLFSIRQTYQAIQDQTRLTMGKIATNIVQLGSVDEPPSKNTLQQYFSRLVQQRIEGQLYSVDITFIAYYDGGDNLLAFAINDQVQITDTNGNLLRLTDPVVARNVFQMSRDGMLSHEYDIIPVQAILQGAPVNGEPRIAASVYIGCKRSIANRVIIENVAKNIVMMLMLIGVAYILSVRAARQFSRPVEGIGETLHRLAEGNYNAPLLPGGEDEVGKMRTSLEAIKTGLRQREMLQQTLLGILPGSKNKDESLEDSVWLQLSCITQNMDPAPLNQQLIECMFKWDARLEISDQTVQLRWNLLGSEGEVWAAMAALELQEQLAKSGYKRSDLVICLASQREQLLAQDYLINANQPGEKPAIWLDAEITELISVFASVIPTVAGDSWHELVQLFDETMSDDVEAGMEE